MSCELLWYVVILLCKTGEKLRSMFVCFFLCIVFGRTDHKVKLFRTDSISHISSCAPCRVHAVMSRHAPVEVRARHTAGVIAQLTSNSEWVPHFELTEEDRLIGWADIHARFDSIWRILNSVVDNYAVLERAEHSGLREIANRSFWRHSRIHNWAPHRFRYMEAMGRGKVQGFVFSS